MRDFAREIGCAAAVQSIMQQPYFYGLKGLVFDRVGAVTDCINAQLDSHYPDSPLYASLDGRVVVSDKAIEFSNMANETCYNRVMRGMYR